MQMRGHNLNKTFQNTVRTFSVESINHDYYAYLEIWMIALRLFR